MNILDTVNQITRSFDQVESIVQALPFAVVLTNEKNEILYHNEMFEQMLGKKEIAYLLLQPLKLLLNQESLEFIQIGMNLHTEINGNPYVVRKEAAYVHGEKHYLYVFSSVEQLEQLLNINREKSVLQETVMEYAYDGNAIIEENESTKNEFKEQNKALFNLQDIIGDSSSLIKVKQETEKVALSDSSILLIGESGTGKELFAHSIHHASKRSSSSFVKVNCAGVPADLLATELFGSGYGEGSATATRISKVEAADGGTLFLDEIDELPLHIQVKLLDFLQETEVQNVGSSVTKKLGVRIVAATNKGLEDLVEEGEFSLDLYNRLNGVSIQIPNLIERKRDLTILVNHFIHKFNSLMQKQVKRLSKEAEEKLYQYQWPGNIRELESVLERAVNLVEGDLIEVTHLPDKLLTTTLNPIVPLADLIEKTEREALLTAIDQANGNRSKAAQLLNVSRTTFYEKLTKYDLV
ncbi:sigma-54 interaction domain-containing protein [Halalkalibacter akibai]|uniref:Transcriptional regulator n=1 Tax=Halalkalibacter akibai (strain ATCC 43226 / DSM 21942 / CIP 109018 / JCM 9157 / 1139) TaxID=1236973 RepID=W4R0B0_HALA3|nr:sigma 54-interacting transcriptional regulator [Halalkalibacter akibai]GAE36984.1 transcriptional regulator [Halalkalibacter akibai JCM 9157]